MYTQNGLGKFHSKCFIKLNSGTTGIRYLEEYPFQEITYSVTLLEQDSMTKRPSRLNEAAGLSQLQSPPKY